MMLLVACSANDRAWQETVRIDTPEAYSVFMKRSPSSAHVEDARIRRDALIDEEAWIKARTDNTAKSYAAYLATHPVGIWSQLAARRRDAAVVVTSHDAAVRGTPKPRDSGAALVGTGGSVVVPPPSHFVQLGAFSSAAAARRSWGVLQGSFAELRSLQPVITELSVPGTQLYRLRVRLSSQEEAKTLCASLVQKGGACLASPRP